MPMKLMAYNILIDGADDACPDVYNAGNRRDPIADVILKHDPDILCMQEGGDHPFWRQFARENGYVFMANIDGTFRPALLAKHDPVSCTRFMSFFPGAVYARFKRDGRSLGVYSIHLPPRMDDDAGRLTALKTLKAHMDEVGDDWVCVAGDHNSRSRGEWGEPWGREMLAAHDNLDAASIDETQWIAATDQLASWCFVDCYRKLHTDKGQSIQAVAALIDRVAPQLADQIAFDDARIFGSTHARIDYIFACPALAKQLISCDIDDSIDTRRASDHLPFLAAFDI